LINFDAIIFDFLREHTVGLFLFTPHNRTSILSSPKENTMQASPSSPTFLPRSYTWPPLGSRRDTSVNDNSIPLPTLTASSSSSSSSSALSRAGFSALNLSVDANKFHNLGLSLPHIFSELDTPTPPSSRQGVDRLLESPSISPPWHLDLSSYPRPSSPYDENTVPVYTTPPPTGFQWNMTNPDFRARLEVRLRVEENPSIKPDAINPTFLREHTGGEFTLSSTHPTQHSQSQHSTSVPLTYTPHPFQPPYPILLSFTEAAPPIFHLRQPLPATPIQEGEQEDERTSPPIDPSVLPRNTSKNDVVGRYRRLF
jgi:hypothetical protein